MAVAEHTISLAGQPIHVLSAARPAGGSAPLPLFLHGLPTGAADLVPLLERCGGVAVDLPGFGRSGKGGHLDYSLEGHVGTLERLLHDGSLVGLGAAPDSALVGHAWGGLVALELARRHSVASRPIVLIDPVAPVAGFSWPRVVHLLRRRALGELLMGAVGRRALGRWLGSGAVRDDAWPQGARERVWGDFDQGTQRALLRLHRASPESRVRHAGREMSTLTGRVLILWGERDRWLDPGLAHALATLLQDATVELVPDAGHWPWLDRPDLAGRIAAFLR